MTGIATPGDVRLLPLLIQAERRLGEIGLDEAEQVLGRASDYSSPFINILWRERGWREKRERKGGAEGRAWGGGRT